MEHLNATYQSNIVVTNSERFVLSAVTVMNLLAQLEWKAIGLAVLASILVSLVDGHGRLFDPPSRSTAWRVGFDTPRDYNDMEGFCGGFDRQWLVNSGRCGVCGDPYDEVIKPHEAPGGLFATGTIVRNYMQGQIIPVTIQITATHRGFYEFRLCPNNNPKKDPTQDCFEKYSLNFIDDTGATNTKFSLENLSPATYHIQIQLPPQVTCSQCVIQWTYVTGNRWGVCHDETSRLGCGPQESFRACSDVAIFPIGGTSSTIISTILPQPVTTIRPYQTSSSAEEIRPTTSKMTTASPPILITTTVVTNSSTIRPLLTRPPSIFTTRRPNRPVNPVRPGPTDRPTPPGGTLSPGVFTIPPIFGPFTRPTIQPIVKPTALPLKPRPTSLRPTSTTSTKKPFIPPQISVGSGECTNYVPVASQNSMSGMTAWCNNNCRLGYCPSDYCKCSL